MIACLLLTCALVNEPSQVLPSDVRLSVSEVLALVIPGYEKKVLRTTLGSDGAPDPFTVYRASIFSAERTDLGIPGKDLLVVLIHELDTECTGCHSSILGVIDLHSGRLLSSCKEQGLPVALDLGAPSGGPRHISFRYWVGNRFGGECRRQIVPKISGKGEVSFQYQAREALQQHE